MEKTEFIKELLMTSIEKLMLILGCVFFLIAFNPVSYDKDWVFKFNYKSNFWFLGLGIVLVAIAIYRTRKPKILESPQVTKIADGIRIELSADHIIDVVTGAIENITTDSRHGAVVLPANTSFDDQCIHDERSALGSFFLRHFPSGIADIQKLIRNAAIEACGETDQSFTAAPPGTTIILEKPLGSSFRVMITAVTIADPEQGITTDTLSLIN